MTAVTIEMTRRLLWFVGLWLLGVAVVGTVAFAIRTILMGMR